jgi:hypothetical protein
MLVLAVEGGNPSEDNSRDLNEGVERTRRRKRRRQGHRDSFTSGNSVNHTNIGPKKREHKSMLDWHCSLQSKESLSTLCVSHLNHGRTQDDKKTLVQDHLETKNARKLWCSLPSHNSSSYCTSFIENSLDVDLRTMKDSISWWCGPTGGSKSFKTGDVCEIFLKLMLNAESKALEEGRTRDSSTKVRRKFGKRLAQLYWKRMKERGDTEFHHLLESWCQEPQRNSSSVCRRWEIFHHDHIREL